MRHYPIITYSHDTCNTNYSKLNWRQKLLGTKPEFLGYTYRIEIVLCREALDYCKAGDILYISGTNWFVESRGQAWLVIRNVKPTNVRKPITCGDRVTKIGVAGESASYYNSYRND